MLHFQTKPTAPVAEDSKTLTARANIVRAKIEPGTIILIQGNALHGKQPGIGPLATSSCIADQLARLPGFLAYPIGHGEHFPGLGRNRGNTRESNYPWTDLLQISQYNIPLKARAFRNGFHQDMNRKMRHFTPTEIPPDKFKFIRRGCRPLPCE